MAVFRPAVVHSLGSGCSLRPAARQTDRKGNQVALRWRGRTEKRWLCRANLDEIPFELIDPLLGPQAGRQPCQSAPA